jgi:hypothetical protein
MATESPSTCTSATTVAVPPETSHVTSSPSEGRIVTEARSASMETVLAAAPPWISTGRPSARAWT